MINLIKLNISPEPFVGGARFMLAHDYDFAFLVKGFCDLRTKMELLLCSKCHKLKKREDYHRNKSKKRGCNTYCKQCQNEYRKENKKYFHKKWRNHYQKNKNKFKCRHKTYNAIKKGALKRMPCQFEGCSETENIHAHHYDYDKPLNVKWLCRKHHYQTHRKE